MPLEKVGWRSDLQEVIGNEHARISFDNWLQKAIDREAPVSRHRLLELAKRSYRIPEEDPSLDNYILQCINGCSAQFDARGYAQRKHPAGTFREGALDYILIDDVSPVELETLFRAIKSLGDSSLDEQTAVETAFAVLSMQEAELDEWTQQHLSRVFRSFARA